MLVLQALGPDIMVLPLTMVSPPYQATDSSPTQHFMALLFSALGFQNLVGKMQTEERG